jgi:hypothetical protein
MNMLCFAKNQSDDIARAELGWRRAGATKTRFAPQSEYWRSAQGVGRTSQEIDM